ncbi:winged helix-turn-helix domain-containing protein [Alkalicoccobacillus gibsonii]|uniref:winged helix-turn-helix domain-containing protein n=1 Tax=Alkalicoccobacillus gibsonii TaxID=79881 RepID=UPI003518933C
MAREQILLIDDSDDLYDKLDQDARGEHFILIRQRSDLMLEKVMHMLEPKLIIIGETVIEREPLELCTLLREQTLIPIIMTLGRSCTMQKVVEAGANDFLSTPVPYDELLLRIKAHLNHYRRTRDQLQCELQLDDLFIDLISQKVQHYNKQIDLSAQEFKLLTFLAHRPNTVFSTDQLFYHVWEEERLYDSKTVMVHISNIRKKLPPKDGAPSVIQTIHGVGYTIHDFYC